MRSTCNNRRPWLEAIAIQKQLRARGNDVPTALSDWLIAAVALAAGAGVVLLWRGWSAGPVAGRAEVMAGWALIGVASFGLVWSAGMWGLSVAWLGAMLGAHLLLGHVALATPAGRVAPEREPRPSVTLHSRNWPDFARRIGIFLAVVPGALIAALVLTLGLHAALRSAGWSEANNTVMALGVFPTAWVVLVTLQMIEERLSRMLPPLLICAIAGALFWSLGSRA